MSETFTKSELLVLQKILEDASEAASNAGCNDTPDAWARLMDGGMQQAVVDFTELDGETDEFACDCDFIIIDYLADKCGRLAGQTRRATP